MTPGKAFLTSDEIRALARRSNAMGLLLLLHCYAVISLALGLFALWPNPLTFLLAIMLIGSRQLGLAILMHDAAHNALFASRTLNDWAGEWLCGRPILAELSAYRRYHLTHHRFTQTEQDPDLTLSSKFPTTRASLKRKFLRDLTGQTGGKQLLAQVLMSLRLAGDADAMDAAKLEAAQAFNALEIWKSLPVFLGIALLMSLVGDWWWGFAFWILPYLTWFQFVLRIRNIAEHGATEKSDDPFRNVRTTFAGPLARTFIAPYWVNYHLEHHLVMHVPCWQLQRMHAVLRNKGLDARMNLAKNYRAVLNETGWRNT